MTSSISGHTVYLVRCKCPGPLGVARVTVDHRPTTVEGREALQQALSFMGWSGLIYRCAGCRRSFDVSTLRGTVKADHKCDARCLASKGPSCECACGGANHGRSWA